MPVCMGAFDDMKADKAEDKSNVKLELEASGPPSWRPGR